MHNERTADVREIIFNAQVYANAGGIGYKKAVDMAVKDMLNAGLNCVEYKNGARHTLEDYASMAIRTATKRAYLQGEGTKRKEWGISTVILNKRPCPCPKCLPFVSKVFIDDVWSGGTAEEAKEKGYPLLSTAIEQGLYHPNCKDTHTTYFEGISTPPEKPTVKEKQKAVDEYNQNQKAHYNAQQAKKCERISEYSLDDENKRIYKARVEQWRDKEKSLKPVAKSGGSGIIKLKTDNKAFYKENTYLDRGIELPENLKNSLLELQKPGDFIKGKPREFSRKDLSALSKETGVEFACITIQDISYLIRGDSTGVNIPNELFNEMVRKKGTLDFHSHPYSGDCIPSLSDKEIMELLEEKTGQKTSEIVTTDNQDVKFDKHGVISVESVKNNIDESYAKALLELFGGEINDI